MSNKIFPAEIINNTTEQHFAINSKPFKRIYVAILILLIGAITSLPLITIDITTQSRGILKTRKESSPIQTGSYGLVEYCNIEEGKNVKKGDTLIVLDTDKIEEQIKQISKTIADNKLFISDLGAMIKKGDNLGSACIYRCYRISNQIKRI